MNNPTLSLNEHADMLTAPQAMKKFQMSRHILERVSRACGAKYVVGRWVRYDKEKIVAYLANTAETPQTAI